MRLGSRRHYESEQSVARPNRVLQDWCNPNSHHWTAVTHTVSSNDTPYPLPSSLVSVWQRLERLSEVLAVTDRSSTVPALLGTARDSLAADVVFLDPGTTGSSIQLIGPLEMTAGWCRDLIGRVLATTPQADREVLRSNPVPGVAGVAMVCLSRTRGIWLAAARFKPNRPFDPSDVRLLSLVRRLYADHLIQSRAKDDLKAALLGLIHCLSSALDARDAYTAGHSERVARMAVRLAEQMRLPTVACGDLYLAGLLHDLGKIGVPDAVLLKPGPLTDAEFAVVKDHPVIGERIVGQVKQLKHLCPGVRWHHERWDGKGYPDGRAGEDVPLMGRLLAVADSLDAMTSDRPYRTSMPRDEVETVLRAGAGVQWDPQIIDAFFACSDDLYAICSRGLGMSVAAALDRGNEEVVKSLPIRAVVAETR